MHSFLHTLVSFNTWANNKCVESLKSCPDIPNEALIRLSHILENNWYVYDIIHERDLHKWDDDRNYTFEECIAEIPQIDTAFKALLEGTSQAGLDRPVRFTDIRGNIVERAIAELIFHTFDHCTYHRGQIAMIVRQAGGEPAKTWFNRWITETERGTKS